MNDHLTRRVRDNAAKGALALTATAGVSVGLPSTGVNTTATGLAMAATLGGGLALVTYATSKPRPREVEPRLSYDGLSEDLDPGAVYEITYEISGDESGPVIETAELSDRTSLNYTESTISTASAGVKVSVKITDITAQGQ